MAASASSEGWEAWDERSPAEIMVLRFRYVLEKHTLATQSLQTANDPPSA